MHMVAVGVTLRILHVPNQGVGPVAKPQRPVRPDLWVNRAEMLVGRFDQVKCGLGVSRIVPHAVTLKTRSIIFESPAGHPVHVDNARVQKLSLHIIGKLPAVQKFTPHHRSHAFGVEHGVQTLAASVLRSRKWRVPVLAGHRAVTAEALPPLVKHIAPRIAIAGGHKVTHLPSAWVQHIRAWCAKIAEWPPRGLKGRAHRDPFQHVQEPRVVELKGAHRVMGILGGKTVQHMDNLICFVIPIRVLQPQNPRLVSHQHPPVEKFKAGGAV